MYSVRFCSEKNLLNRNQYDIIIVLLDGEYFMLEKHPEVFTSLGPPKRYDRDIARFLKGSGYSYMKNKKNYKDFVNSYPEVLL